MHVTQGKTTDGATDLMGPVQAADANTRNGVLADYHRGVGAMSFALLRPRLLVSNLTAQRDRPRLHHLRTLVQPERFVWAILPHAARTFSACIAMLPARAARAAAVGYLYCRMLDTYEDLHPDAVARIDALGHVNQTLCGVRFQGHIVPEIGTELMLDDKKVGRVTSATYSPRLAAPLALAYVRRGHNAVGAALASPLGSAEVIQLPL